MGRGWGRIAIRRAEVAVLVARGTYVLILRLEVRREIQVGRLGRFTFPAGH